MAQPLTFPLSVSKDQIRREIELVNKEREQALMNLHRCDGALFMLNRLLDPPEVEAVPTRDITSVSADA